MTRSRNRSDRHTVRNVLVALSMFFSLALATPAHVHHSGAMFDPDKVIEITGTVTEFNWRNPHASFRVDVPNAEGKVESWAIEMNSPNNLMHLGWKRTSIKAGDKVTVKINPLRDGRPGGLYIGITLPDGTYLGTDKRPAGEKPASEY